MKKMNFYFNFGRCRTLILPALMFLLGTVAFAGNSSNIPFMPGYKSVDLSLAFKQSAFKYAFKAPMAISTPTLTPTRATDCAGTDGELKVVTTISGIAVPHGYQIDVYKGDVLETSVTSGVIPAGTTTEVDRDFGPLGIGTYSVKVTTFSESGAPLPTSSIIETVTSGTVEILSKEQTAPVTNCPANQSFSNVSITPTVEINGGNARVRLDRSFGADVVFADVIDGECDLVLADVSIEYTGAPAAITSPFSGPITVKATTADGQEVSCSFNLVVSLPALATGLTGDNPSCANNDGAVQFVVAPALYNSGTPFLVRMQIFKGAEVVSEYVSPRYNNSSQFTGHVLEADGLAAGEYSARVQFEDPNGTVLSSFTSGPGFLNPIGPNEILVAEDDNEDPVFSGDCPAEITVAATAACNFTPAVTAGQGTKEVTTNLGKVITDVCSNTNVTFSQAELAVGTTTDVVITALDAEGNESTCTVSVTVEDQTPPTIATCPVDMTVNIEACKTTALVEYTPPTITDNCTPINLIRISDLGPATGSELTAGIYWVRYTAVDSAGNAAACEFKITVVAAPDVTAPTITCPEPVAVTEGDCGAKVALPNYGNATATDNCTADNLITITRTGGLAAGTEVNAGVYPITYTASDASGNRASCTFNVTVNAGVKPALVGGSITNTSAPALTACNTSGTLTYTLVPPTGGCAPIVLENVTGLASGSTVVAGSYPITATWRDAAGQVTAPVTTTITIAPSTTCTAEVGQVVNKVDADCNVNNGSISINSLATVLPTGVCYFLRVERQGSPNPNGLPLGTNANTPANFVLSNLAPGTYTVTGQVFDCVTLTVLDVRVNTITIGVKSDNAAPTVVACAAPAAVTEGACGAPVAIAYADATFTDNCTPAANLIIDRVGPANGSSLTAGTYKVLFTASDLSGNKTSCSIDVVVNKFVDNVAPVLTACPANQTYPVACGSRANVVYTAPTATDNCPVSPVTVTQTGPVSGSLLDAGVYPVVFTATDAAGNATTCSFTITVTNPAPTNLACIGGSATSPGANITLDASCSMVIRPNHVLLSCIGNEADYDVVVSTTGGTVLPNATVGIGQVGKVLRVMVTYRPTGVSCWGFVKIEDKTAPTIVCPSNVTLPCDKANDANNLAIVGELSGPNSPVAALNQVSAANATATGANDGRVQECSKWTQFWSDVKTGSVCAGFTITRTWWAKDEWGNQSSTCTQIIRIAAPAQVTPVVADVTLACADVNANGKAALFTDTIYRPTGGASCGLSFELVSTREIALCPGSYKILRQWNAVNMCVANMVTPLPTQTIIVTNTATPTVTANYDNYTRQEDGEYCWLMNGTMQMTDKKYKTAINNVTTTFNAGTTTISPLASSTMCGAANIRVQLAGTDNGCAPGALTYSVDDSRVQISASGLITNKQGQPFMKNANGTNPSFTVTATNACGAFVKHTFTVNLEDNMTPNTVCKVFTTATLDENGFVRVPLSAFENGSSDNCGIERQMVRRMTKSNNDACGVQGQVAETACWNDYVDFTCADLGDKDADGGQLMVVLRTVDAAGNVSDCMVRIDLVDKTAPTCTNQPQINRICTDVELSSYKRLFSRPAAFDNCGIVKVDSSDNKELVLACGKGDVTRSWTFTDCGGAKTTCTQKLVVNPVYGFTVPKLANDTLACALGTTDIATIMENDRRKILASASLTTFSGTKTCSAPIVETEYWKYSSSQYCQIYRVRYTIIDKCAPFYGYTIGAPGTCNVMRSGDGSRQWGTPNATCSQVESVVGAIVNGEQQHIVIYERFINVNDVTAPTTTLPVAPDACTTYSGAAGAGSQITNVNCDFNYYTKLVGQDDCGNGTAVSDPSTVTFMWRVVNKTTGAQVKTGTTADVYLTNLAFGKYTICYRVTDLCGNMSQEYCYDIEGKDCKRPEVLVHNKIVALAGVTGVRSTGMANLFYNDIKNAIWDNCSGNLTNSNKVTMELGGLTAATAPTAPVSTQSIRFTCNDLFVAGGTATSSRNIEVRVWAQDGAGNWNYAISTITLQDNEGICNNINTVVVSGSALTEGNAAVANVAVSASVNGAVVASTNAVNSTFTLAVAPSTNVQVRAAKTNNDDAATGVTTFDIAKVSQHVLDIEKLATPYKLIAADVDKSGVIDALDMLHMRRFILKITPSLPGGNFRFVNKAYAFRNAADPFGEDFPEVVNIASLTSNTSANFVAVKLGDVNDSYAGTTVRGSRSLTLNANDMNVVAGSEYTVNISADKMDAAAFQGTFSFNGATVKSVKAGNLANMTDGNFGIFANAVTTSWNGKTQDAADVMTITFVANKSGKLSDMLTVNSALTQSVANDATGNEMNVNLKFNTGKVAGGEFALYQNQPNPVAGETTIGFNLPKDGAARLTVTSVDGKVVKVLNGEYKAGYNTVTINKSDIQASGVFYYRLETADHSASKKMVIME